METIMSYCPECGSPDVVADALVGFDPETGGWTDIVSVLDERSCNACGAEGFVPVARFDAVPDGCTSAVDLTVIDGQVRKPAEGFDPAGVPAGQSVRVFRNDDGVYLPLTEELAAKLVAEATGA